jgi:hypothetical protein
MKAAFMVGLALGLLGTVAAARYYPWVDHPRLASKTTVVQNGGRAERFLIRLPADRLVAAGSQHLGERGAPFPGEIAPPTFADQGPVLAEHFKVRDVDGHVIGLAARHWTMVSGAPVISWSLVVPSRGALLLAGVGEAEGALEAALLRAGSGGGNGARLAVASWEDGKSLVVGGSDEFAALTGRYSETWLITGADEHGMRGSIELATITYQDR